MQVRFKSELETGILEIDTQHRELFYRFNKLIECYRDVGQKDATADILEYLENYVNVHFKSEEELMEKYSYDKKREHIRHHEEFKENLSAIRDIYNSEGISDRLMNQTNRLIVDWFVQHIEEVDTALAAFIKAKGDK